MCLSKIGTSIYNAGVMLQKARYFLSSFPGCRSFVANQSDRKTKSLFVLIFLGLIGRPNNDDEMKNTALTCFFKAKRFISTIILILKLF